MESLKQTNKGLMERLNGIENIMMMKNDMSTRLKRLETDYYEMDSYSLGSIPKTKPIISRTEMQVKKLIEQVAKTRCKKR